MDWANEDRVRDLLFYCHRKSMSDFHFEFIVSKLCCTEEEYSNWMGGRVKNAKLHEKAVAFCKQRFDDPSGSSFFFGLSSAKQSIPADFLKIRPMSLRSQRLTCSLYSKKLPPPPPSPLKSEASYNKEEESAAGTISEDDDAEESIVSRTVYSWRGALNLQTLDTTDTRRDRQKALCEISLCTWNLKNIGENTDERRKARLANILIQKDIVAVQEVRSENLKNLFDNPVLRQEYEFVESNVALQKTRKQTRVESLAFVFRKDKVKLLGKQTLSKHEKIRYSPFLCKFEVNNRAFFVLNVHISHYGASEKSRRRAEINEILLIVKRLLDQQQRKEEIYICGDFNLEPSDPIFVPWMTLLNYRECNTSKQTTIGVEKHIYDNIWIPNGSQFVNHSSVQVGENIAVDALSAQKKSEIRKEQSDHLPVSINAFF